MCGNGIEAKNGLVVEMFVEAEIERRDGREIERKYKKGEDEAPVERRSSLTQGKWSSTPIIHPIKI